jgi:hypothetical protein
VNISRNDEDAVRSILREQVADVYASEDLVRRVETGGRRRRTVRRITFSASALAVAGCVAGLVFALGSSRTAQQTPVASPPIACPAPASLPEGWELAGVQTKPAVPGAAHSLMPGSPIAAVSCAVTGARRATGLTADELAATATALKSAPFNSPIPGNLCREADPSHQSLYLVFAYADGARLTVVAYPTLLCNGKGAAYWNVNNGTAHSIIQSPALDTLGG